MSKQDEIRKQVTDEIVAMLEQGVAPWRRPWVDPVNGGFPTNVVSKNPYHGVNPILLTVAAIRRGFRSKWWGTFNQWQSLGGQVKARPADVKSGRWGTKVVLYRPIKRITTDKNGDEKESSFPLLRQFTVFNADQVDGDAIEKFRVQDGASLPAFTDYDPAEHVIRATGADIRHEDGSKAAYFRPPADRIVLPQKWQFAEGPGGLPGYYDTVFHELCHWSEHRLGWSGSYALGELRAELGAVYLVGAVEIPQADSTLIRNNAQYLAGWIKALTEDHRVIFQIASAASKAADFVLDFSRPAELVDDVEEAGAA